MKKNIKLYIVPRLFFLIIAGSFFSIIGISQSIEQTLAMAKLQKQAGNYELSSSLFQRVLFFDSNFVHTAQANVEIAENYELSNDFPNAVKHMGNAYRFANEAEKIEILLKKAELYLLSNEKEYALTELLDLPENLTEEQQYKQHTMLGITYFLKQNYTESQANFEQCCKTELQKAALAKNIRNAQHADKKFPKWVRYTSLLLPGTAQFVYGDYKGGLNSLALVGGFTLLYLHTINSYSLIDAWLSVFPWYIRYYQGGFENTAEIRELRKQAYLNKQLHQILETVSD